jgi:hypothetical protein
MDNKLKISGLVAQVEDPTAIHEWWDSLPNTPHTPSYWKKMGRVVMLRHFGSQGTVVDLQPFTSILARKKTLVVKGWVRTRDAIILVIDPQDLPTDVSSPYLILSISGDVVDPDRIVSEVKTSHVNPCRHEFEVKVGYRDRLLKRVRFDIPNEL